MRMRQWLLTALLFSLVTAGRAQSLPFTSGPDAAGDSGGGTVLVVKFKPQTGSKARQFSPDVRNYYVLQQLGVKKLTQPFPGRVAAGKDKRAIRPGLRPVDLSRIYQFRIAPGLDVEKALKLLRSDAAIEYAEPLYTNYAPLYVPNDPQAQPLTGGQFQLAKIKAYEAWDIQKGNPAITIGIADFGTDANHEDLRDNIRYNTADPVDGVDNDNDGMADNYAGWNFATNTSNLAGASNSLTTHGSFVAGMAAGTPDNGKGIAGAGFNCKFMPVTIDGSKGYNGLLYLAERGCKVINLSWGRPGFASRAEEDIINYVVYNYDVVLVAAAGNSHSADYYWPASYENVISVGATESNDQKAVWGGGGSNYNDKVDISAPGSGVYSTTNGSYGINWGTSFSSPLVAGAAALLRSQYPALNAKQIADRLISTSDNIYDIPENAPYVAKLGRGRLNMYRALTETKGAAFVDASLTGYGNQPYAYAGHSANMVVRVKSTMGNLENLKISLTTPSPYVTITSGQATIGALAAGSVAGNGAAPFIFTVRAGTPVNTPVNFLLTYTDGTYTGSEHFTVEVSQDYLDVTVNQLKLTATSRGRIGYNDELTGQGMGLWYKNQSLLHESGLMIGTSPTQLSNCFRDHTGNFTKDDHVRAAKPIWFDASNGADFSATVSFTDSGNPAGTGLQIRQQVYAWKDAPVEKSVIFEYKITNTSDADIPQLYAGIFTDWNIYGYSNNEGAWDALRQTGYVYNKAMPNLFAGIRLLTAEAPQQYYVFDTQSELFVYDGFSPEEKFRSMSEGIARTPSVPAALDVMQTIGTQLSNLKKGETRTVAFALVAGDNLTDLQKQADAIRQQFIRVKTSPLPVVARTGYCKDESVLLAPGNGNAFRLYAREGDTSPIASGTSFHIGPIRKDTTLYLAGADSLYESQRIAVTLKALIPTAAISANRDTLGIIEGHQLELNAGGTEATEWLWDFGDGSTSREQHPVHAYAVPGTYEVKLTAVNHIGCTGSASRIVRVFEGLKSPAPTVRDFSVCLNEAATIRPGNGTSFKFYTSHSSEQLVFTGSAFQTGPITRDTLFYVTGNDFLTESDPVTVRISGARPHAAFRANAHRLDLREEEVLRLTDASAGAVEWLWDFGDGSTSREPNPVHAYAAPGEYEVKLLTRNSLGCTAEATRRVAVFRTAVEDLSIAVQVYPNPSDGKFTLRKDNGFVTDHISLLVTDLLGREILRKEISQPGKLSSLFLPAPGLYQVRITANGQTMVKRVWVR